jgi:anti-anti-sigma factor
VTDLAGSDLPGSDLPGAGLPGQDEPLLTVQVERRGGRNVAVLIGELDMSNADAVLTRLVEALEDGAGLDVDLAGLAFIDSAGIGMLHRLNRHLLAAAPQLRDSGLRVLAASDTVAGRTLRLAGMDQVLPLRDPGAA